MSCPGTQYIEDDPRQDSISNYWCRIHKHGVGQVVAIPIGDITNPAIITCLDCFVTEISSDIEAADTLEVSNA